MAHPLAPKIWTPTDPRRATALRPQGAGDVAIERVNALTWQKYEDARKDRKIVRPVVLLPGGDADWKLLIFGASNNSTPQTLWANPSDHTKTFFDVPAVGNLNIFVSGSMIAGFSVSFTDPGPISFDAKIEILDSAGATQITYQFQATAQTMYFPSSWFFPGSLERWGSAGPFSFNFTPPDLAHSSSPTFSGIRSSVFNIVGDTSVWGCGIAAQMTYLTGQWKVISV